MCSPQACTREMQPARAHTRQQEGKKWRRWQFVRREEGEGRMPALLARKIHFNTEKILWLAWRSISSQSRDQRAEEESHHPTRHATPQQKRRCSLGKTYGPGHLAVGEGKAGGAIEVGAGACFDVDEGHRSVVLYCVLCCVPCLVEVEKEVKRRDESTFFFSLSSASIFIRQWQSCRHAVWLAPIQRRHPTLVVGVLCCGLLCCYKHV
jgi:hypothetical protein